jgi:shikimate kinase
MLLKLKRTPGIYLVGFMGSGKTTIGRALADIEAAQGMSIADIFDARGEEEFRNIERAAMRKRVGEVERGKPMVVALGGGTFSEAANQALLDANGLTIWLDCPFTRVCSRLEGSTNRPLARDPEKFQQLFEDRRPDYSQAAHRIEIDSDDPAAIVASILKLPVF